MEELKQQLLENLRMLLLTAGVQIQMIPMDSVRGESGNENTRDSEKHISICFFDKQTTCEEEFSESDEEEEGSC